MDNSERLEKDKNLRKVNTNWVLNCNVPLNDGGELLEWLDDCKKRYDDNRWRKMWDDHIYNKEIKHILTNIMLEISSLKQKLLITKGNELIIDGDNINSPEYKITFNGEIVNNVTKIVLDMNKVDK